MTPSYTSADPVPDLHLAVSEDPASLRDAWLALDIHARDPFCGYAWSNAWYAAMNRARGTQPVIVSGRDANGDLCFVLPLVRERKLGMRVLARPGRSISGDYTGVMSPGLRAALNAERTQDLWRRIARVTKGDDVLILNGVTVRKHNPLAWLPHLPASAASYALRLESDWDAQYDRMFSTKLKRNDRRSLKRLHETGRVEFVRPTDPIAQAQLLDVLLEQKRRQIDASGEQHQLNCPFVQDFYRSLPQAFAQSPAHELVLSALSLDGEVIASSCGILAQHRYFGLFMAMSPGPAKKFSPGRLLLLDINRFLCARGVKHHEFGNGEYQYKKSWSCDRHERVTVTAPVSWRGKLALPVARWMLEQRRAIKTRRRALPPT